MTLTIHSTPPEDVYCLWEAKTPPPAYLVLAMSSWLDYLNMDKLHIINHSNIATYLAPYYDVHALSRFGFSKQGDALEAALLMERGGVCLDLDTILVNNGCFGFLHAGHGADTFRIFGDSERGSMHCAVVSSSPGGSVVTEWTKECSRRIVADSEPVDWSYLANGIVEPIYRRYKGTDAFIIEELSDTQAVVETWHGADLGQNAMERYQRFWFEDSTVVDINAAAEKAVQIPGGLVLLHNSWTPQWFYQLDMSSVLASDTVMGKVLQQVAHPEAFGELESLLMLGSDPR